MTLARTVYDGAGRPLLKNSLELDHYSLAKLTKNRVAEIFVQDPRTADVLVHSPIAPELESQAAKALAALVIREREFNRFGENGHDADRAAIFDNPEQAINAMV